MITALYGVIWGFFGLLIGSFLNVCVYRVPRDLSVIKPRSACPKCAKPIAWFDNIPLLSFAVLRGRCRHCHAPISWRYPLVEFATAILFSLVFLKFGYTLSTVKYSVVEALLIVLFATDAEERILPDEFTLGGIVFGLIAAVFAPLSGGLFDFVLPGSGALHRLIVAALCAVLFSLPFWAFGKLYEKLRSQPDAFGFGDVKLLAMLGACLGFDGGMSAVFIGIVAAAVGGAAYALATRQNMRTTSLPLGAFLSAGGVIAPFLMRVVP